MSSRIVMESIAAANRVGYLLPPSYSRIDRKLYSAAVKGSRMVMDTTAATNHVASGEDISSVSSLPTSPSLHGISGTVSDNNFTCIAPELYMAAVKGNFQKFINIKNMGNLLTPNKNTILHIYLTSTVCETTQHASPTIIQQIQRKFLDFQDFLYHMVPETIQTPVSEQFVNQILDQCESLVLLPNAKGETLLHIAARYGHSNITRLLIDRVKAFPPDIENGITIGAEIKFIRAKNNDKDTALHEAVRYDHIEVVKTLLEIDPECSSYANNSNETPLYMASQRQNQKVVAEILNKVELPAYDGRNNQTALHAAVINQDTEMARDLLMNKHVRVAVKEADKEGWIPLHYAVKTRNRDLTKLLLEQDEKTAYMQDNKGRTALHIAAYSGVWYIMEMIINNYPDCSELVDNKGRNALHYAVSQCRLTTTNRVMVNASLSNLYNEKDIDGNTPLHYLASSYLFYDRLIRHRRVDRVAVNKKDQTPLDVAHGSTEDSRMLNKLTTIRRLERAGAKLSHPVGQKSRNGLENNYYDELEFTKEAKESHLLVATLIATLSFAAGITVPGGTIQDGEHKGSPILGHRASFKAFIVSNTLAMVMAASAAFIHLFSPLKKAKWKDRCLSEIAFSLTLIAVASMVVAFATGTYAVLGSSSVGIAVIIIGLSVFLVFRQVLNINFSNRSLLVFILNLWNIIMFPFLNFTSTPFGLVFILFHWDSHAEGITL